MFNRLLKVKFAEVMDGIKSKSEVVVLDFNQISRNHENYKNIQAFFEDAKARGLDPKAPENRQFFNNRFLQKSGNKYLIGRYGENRIEMLRGSSIAEEGRTIHLGMDLFTEDLVDVKSPVDGEVIVSDREEENHSYGYYCILSHVISDIRFYTFYGHLGPELPHKGTIIRKGEAFSRLGSFANSENGGWSIHLHFQLLTVLPEQGAPIGYSTPKDFELNSKRFPHPNLVLQIPGV